MSPEPARHVPVLPREVITLLDPKPGETWVDATVGAGGHTRQIADRVTPAGRVIGWGQDPTMLEPAGSRGDGLRVNLAHAAFGQLAGGGNQLGATEFEGL